MGAGKITWGPAFQLKDIQEYDSKNNIDKILNDYMFKIVHSDCSCPKVY